MLLSVGHASRLEPAIKHLVDAFQGRSIRVFLRRNFELVHEFSVKISHLGAGELLELGNAADADHLAAVLVGPNWKGSSPESASGNSPVTSVLEPVVKSDLSDMFRNPSDIFVVFDNLVADFFHLDEPRGDRFVDERCIGSPAEWIRVHKHVLLDQTTALFDIGNQRVVGLLDVNALGDGNLFSEKTISIDGAGKVSSLFDNSVGHANAEIVLSESGCLVNNSGTGIVGDVGIGHDLEVGFRTREIVKEWLVSLSLEIGTHKSLFDGVQFIGHLGLPLFLVHGGIDLGKPRLGHDVSLVGFLVQDLDVFHFGVDAKRQVGGECPRGGRPGHQGNTLKVGIADNGEGNHYGRIAHVLVIGAGL
mmetsp:Transcript_7226/g.14933  ORF Transcript_7226/g.14933 Transcript_7226/m.14933 type:complete len:362 (-) Transcript_7226:516-1601(-)